MRPAESSAAESARHSPSGTPLPWWRAALALGLAAGAIALLYQAGVDGRFVSVPGWQPGEKQRMWQLFCWSLVAGLAVVGARPGQAHRVLASALLLWTVVTFGPVAVAGVAALVAGAAAIGRRLLRAIDPALTDPLAAVSAGTVALAAAVGGTAAMRWHWPAAYALALALALVLLKSDVFALVRELRAWWAPRTGPFAVGRLLPWALWGAVVALQIAVAARPEVGADALGMHLELAIEMAREHRFRFDVTRHAWAVMPMGADWLYAAAYQFAGEAGAKLANLGALLLLLAWIVRLGTEDGEPASAPAVVAAALFASTPLAFTETGSLFIENYWAALLLGATLAGERAVRDRSLGWAVACLWLAAGAMQAKVIALLWIAPLLLVVALAMRSRWPALGARHVGALALAVAVLAWPYVNAWWRTGNPVFPFLNALFRSPLFDTGASFNNILYNSPLSWRSWYDLVVHSGRHFEGAGGAAGVHWLVLFPAVFLLLRRDQARIVLPALLLAAGFFVLTWQQQSYLRYLYPALALLMALAARIVEPLRYARGALLLVVATPLAAANLELMPSGGWWNSSFCLRCGFDAAARSRYVARYADQRPVVDWLNANAPGTGVGWLRTTYAGPAGLASPLWRTSWHDYAAWRELSQMTAAEEIAAYARSRRTMLFVLPQDLDRDFPLERAIADFRDRHTVPVLASGGTLLARWADTPDRRLYALPADLERVQRNTGVAREGERVTFAPRGLAWLEIPADPPTLLSYAITSDCAPGGGRGVVQAAWVDGSERLLAADTRYIACRGDGAGATGSFFAPVGARGLRLYVGSAGETSFALSAFTVSQR
ncbi:MAG: hypothetical protein IPJ62_18565 [Betaproteobacteria bacterium]|nr:hypothetical protein [Betaproteobacteria bacterium]